MRGGGGLLERGVNRQITVSTGPIFRASYNRPQALSNTFLQIDTPQF